MKLLDSKSTTKILITVLAVIIVSILLKLSIGKIENFLFPDRFDPDIEKTPVSEELSEIPVYIINMESRKDRQEHMTKLMKALGFKNYTFVRPVPIDVAVSDPMMEGTNFTPSKASNTLTFFKIFKEAPYDKYIIMEDDIDIYFNDTNMTEIYNSAKSHPWDLLYFEFCFADCKNLVNVASNLYKLPAAVCTGCTMFKKEAGLKLVENFDNKSGAKDRYFSNMNVAGEINSYGYPLFRQNPKFGSDLEGSFKYKHANLFAKICSGS